MKVLINMDELKDAWWNEVNKKENIKVYSGHIQKYCQEDYKDHTKCRYHSDGEFGECGDCPFSEFISDFENFMVESVATTLMKNFSKVVDIEDDE